MTDSTHYPTTRHEGGFHVLFCDGHVVKFTQDLLADRLFYAQGP